MTAQTTHSRFLNRIAQNEVVNEVLAARGYSSLNPTQKNAVEAGLLSDDSNFVVASPTASGKTVIGELAVIDAVKRGKKGIYLVPLRSLGTEKKEDFAKYIRYKLALKTGDYDSREERLRDYDIIVSTYEKWDSILRHRPDWLASVGCVVADEGHMLTDGSRGATIEVLLTRMTHLKVKVVILSAVLRNVKDVAKWLHAKYMESTWRPTPLRKGVYLFSKGDSRGGRGNKAATLESTLRFEDGQRTEVKDVAGNAISNLVAQTLKEGGQCLVFARGRKEAVRIASSLGSVVEGTLSSGELLALSRLSSSDSMYGDDAEASRKLTACVMRGVAFHHAGMASDQKSAVENAFRELKLKVVCSTPTLSQGVNLPARRVIIQSIRRFDPKLGSVTIPRWEFENQAGRAGRPKYDKFGEAIVVSKDKKQQKQILDYVRRPIEELDSKLLVTNPFYSHVLSEICLADSTTRDDVQSFFGRTFAAHIGGVEFVSRKVADVIEFLVKVGLVEVGRDHPARLTKTPLGDRISRLYISPLSVPILLKGLEVSESKPVTTIGLLHLMCCMDDWKPLILSKEDGGEFDWPSEDELLVDEKTAEARYELAMRPATVLQQRIDEVDPTKICERFDIGEGDIHAATEASRWLLYSVKEVARFTGHEKIVPSIDVLSKRVEEGVREELLDLTTIKRIGAKRARLLWNHGIRSRREFETLGDAERDKLLGFRFHGRFTKPGQTNLTDFWS